MPGKHLSNFRERFFYDVCFYSTLLFDSLLLHSSALFLLASSKHITTEGSDMSFRDLCCGGDQNRAKRRVKACAKTV